MMTLPKRCVKRWLCQTWFAISRTIDALLPIFYDLFVVVEEIWWGWWDIRVDSSRTARWRFSIFGTCLYSQWCARNAQIDRVRYIFFRPDYQGVLLVNFVCCGGVASLHRAGRIWFCWQPVSHGVPCIWRLLPTGSILTSLCYPSVCLLSHVCHFCRCYLPIVHVFDLCVDL